MAEDVQSPLTADLSDLEATTALEGNLCAFLRVHARAPHVAIEDRPDLFCVTSSIPSSTLNQAIRPRYAGEHVDGFIDRALAFYASRDRGFRFLVGETATPRNLGQVLAARGFAPQGETIGMRADLHAFTPDERDPDDTTVEEVRTEEQWARWIDTFVRGYDLPPGLLEPGAAMLAAIGRGADVPWRFYLARTRDAPVATALAHGAAGVAGIYYVATVPEARRRGTGGRVTRAALADARADGYRYAVLQPTPPGYGVYRRLGFQECGRWERFAAPGA